MAAVPLPPGAIELVCGPMFAGKTTALLARIDAVRRGGRACFLVRPVRDTRGPVLLRSHSGQAAAEEDGLGPLHGTAVACLRGLVVPEGVRLVAVDEGQFFPDLAAGCEDLAARGYAVVVAALDGDFRRRPFPAVSRLVPLCDKLRKLRATCGCGRKAPFTARVAAVPGEAARGQQVLVGGRELYWPSCRACFTEAA